MLQITSGKFYKSENLYLHKAKGILYSNYSWSDAIETVSGVLEPTEYHSPICSYVFSYVNKMEKDDPPKAGGIVRVGDAEIVEQFMLLLMFGLKAYFSPLREEVEKNCRQHQSFDNDPCIPSNFVPRLFDLGIHGTKAEIDGFSEFVKQTLGLKRSTYKKVINAIKSIRNSLDALNYNIDLAYSILVYCLESLSQGFDNYQSNWGEYEEKQRRDLEEQFKELPPCQAQNIKKILLNSAHLKLKARFVNFIISNINDAFFLDESKNTKAIRYSNLKRALQNSYQMRSSYVHALKPILEHLKISRISDGDSFYWNDEPYLTYSGLLRIVFHVIRNFVFDCETVEKEEYNWFNELPGVITMKMAPQYWIWKTENFDKKDINHRFSALLVQIVEVITDKKPVSDLNDLMKVFEKLVYHSSSVQKHRMIVMYYLYNTILKKSLRMPNYEAFLKTHESEFDYCRIETIIVFALMHNHLPWSSVECWNVFCEYTEKRFHKTSIKLPLFVEIVILGSIANKAFTDGKCGVYNKAFSLAIKESSGYNDVQHFLLKTMLNYSKLNFDSLVTFFSSNKQ